MAYLALLGNLNLSRVTQVQTGAHRDFFPFNTLGGDILCKIPEAHVQTLVSGLFDALRRQKAHLPMPGASVGVSLDPMFLNQTDMIDRNLGRPLFPAGGQRNDFHILQGILLIYRRPAIFTLEQSGQGHGIQFIVHGF